MLVIESKNELLALHRALLELHRNEHLTHRELVGSQFIASIANRVLDELIAIELSEGNAERVDRWRRWRQLSNERPEYQMLARRVCEVNRRNLSDSEAAELLHLMASPFVIDDDTHQHLMHIMGSSLA